MLLRGTLGRSFCAAPLRCVGLAAAVSGRLCAACTDADVRGIEPEDAGSTGFIDGSTTIADNHPFFRTLNAASMAEPVSRTPAEMVDECDVVTRGYLNGMANGRVIDYREGPSLPMNTAVIKIQVSEQLKAAPHEFVYVEYVRGAVSVDVLAKDMPKDVPMLFLLRDSEGHLPEEVYKFEGEGRGRPAGEPLYYFSLPAGIIVETVDGVLYPLGDGITNVFAGTSLDEVQASVEQLIQAE